MTLPQNLPLDWSHAVGEIPRQGLQVVRAATSEEAARLGAALDVLSFESLTVSYHLQPMTQGRYRAEGRLTAVLEQSCVVTLAPVRSVVEEPIRVEFWPADQLAQSCNAAVEHSVLEGEEVEPIENHRLEIGRIVYEIVSAAMDPYPRAEGAEFAWAEDRVSEAAQGSHDGPFAALARWKARHQ
ncbi:MAG TPA: DUF177 domain-containing protein [Hyphomicrobiaceae bacterium]|nr:DUF177 domain-containing protein [Hyphomicrobiaceae bacterium]